MALVFRSSIGWGLLFSNLVLTALHSLLFQRRLSVFERLHRQQAFGRRNLAILKRVCGLDCEVIGQENLPAPPYVIVANHQSTFETITFQAIFPPFAWVLKESLTRGLVIGNALSRLGPIAIRRDAPVRALKQVLREGELRLKAGICVLVFPEGTRFEPGDLGQIAGSAAALARRARVPIVPVVHNAGEFWAPYSATIRPGRVKVKIGKTISAKSLLASSVREVGELLSKELNAME